MANSKQAIKRIHQAEKNRQQNVAMRSMMRTYIKKVYQTIEANDSDNAQAAYQKACSIVDTYARKGLIHPHKAARHKSRLNKRLKAMKQAA